MSVKSWESVNEEEEKCIPASVSLGILWVPGGSGMIWVSLGNIVPTCYLRRAQKRCALSTEFSCFLDENTHQIGTSPTLKINK